MKSTKGKSTKKQNKNVKQEKIDLSREIIIGLTPKKEEESKVNNNKKNKKNLNKNNNKKTKNNKNKKITKQKKQTAKPKNKKQLNKKGKRNLAILKWTSLIILIILCIVLFLSSSIFNIKEIKVINNNKITEEEIIKLSALEKDVNMFKYSNSKILKGIKSNAYIEDVKIKRSLNGVITLDVIERVPSFMLKFANSYVYINNQGYMLELSETPLDLPMIIGFETANEELIEGNRLNVNDLEKLDDVIKIMNTANEIDFSKLITSIDITNKNNYILDISSENKTVQFGTATNINVKLLKIKEILEKESGTSGEIYFQDSERTIFKESV